MPISRVPYYHRITSGIRITARPSYVPAQSYPEGQHFVFAYHIRIENVGAQGVRLLTRRWLIHDDAAGDSVVAGEGVIGKQPHIPAGTSHEYSSFCVLKCVSGWMEGSYHFERDDHSGVDAAPPRFALQLPDEGTDDDE